MARQVGVAVWGWGKPWVGGDGPLGYRLAWPDPCTQLEYGRSLKSQVLAPSFMPQRGVVSMREPQRDHSAKRAVSQWGLVWHRAVSEELWLHALHIKTSGICPSPSVILPLEGLAAPLHTPSDGDLTSCKQPESAGLALGTQTSDPSSTQRQSSHPINLTSKLNNPRPCCSCWSRRELECLLQGGQ